MSVRDGELFIKEAVSSILNQTYTNFILLIVDNASTDKTRSIIKDFKDPRIQLVELSNDIGQASALNKGLSMIKTEFIARMDADDVSYPDRLKKLYDFMVLNKSVSVCGSGYDVIDFRGDLIYTRSAVKTNIKIRRSLIYKNPFCHPSVIFRKKAVEKVGGYSNYMYAQDYDLWLRMSENKKCIFENIPHPLLGYRQNGSSARGNPIAYFNVSMSYIWKATRTLNPVYIFSSLLFFSKGVIAKFIK